MKALPYAEAHWERVVPAPTVDDAYVREQLAPWPDLLDRPWTVLDSGLRCVKLRIADLGDIGDVVARIAIDEPSQAKERALHELFAGELRVPHVIDGDGRRLLMEYVPHEELPGTRAGGERVGAAAATIHRHTREQAGLLDAQLDVAEPFTSAWDGLREYAEQRAPDERILALWDEHDAEIRAACAQPVLVHADFKPANIKWLPDKRDVVVFDWEFAWSGPALFDVGQLLRWGVPPAFEQGFAESYRAGGGVLPDNWQRISALLDLVNMVAFLERAGERPRRDADVRARIDKTLYDSK